MGEIIKEMSSKIKSWLELFKSKKEQILLSAVIILVALSSFALGRYSVEDRSNGKEDSFSSISSEVDHQQKNKDTETDSLSSKDGSIVASKNGTKYYLLTCGGSKRISENNKIYFKDEEEAKLAGYSRASNCSF